MLWTVTFHKNDDERFGGSAKALRRLDQAVCSCLVSVQSGDKAYDYHSLSLCEAVTGSCLKTHAVFRRLQGVSRQPFYWLNPVNCGYIRPTCFAVRLTFCPTVTWSETMFASATGKSCI